MKERLPRTVALSLAYRLVDYSLTGCSPAEPVSASSTVQRYNLFLEWPNLGQKNSLIFVHYTKKCDTSLSIVPHKCLVLLRHPVRKPIKNGC